MNTGSRTARRAWAAALKKHARRGTVCIAEIQHDPACGIYTPERVCNCDPIRVLKDRNGRRLVRVEGAGFYDPLELTAVLPGLLEAQADRGRGL
jgi:hypothetical protein